MPRLEGKRSNTGLYVAGFVLAVLLVLLILELTGAMNLIAGFGAA